MKTPTLIDLVHEVYRRMHGVEPDEVKSAELTEVVESNGVDPQGPNWLRELLAAVVSGGSFDDRSLTTAEMCRREFDVSNFLAELVKVASIPYVNYGEAMILSFDPLDVSVSLDHETRHGGTDVCLMRWPKGTGPHWDTGFSRKGYSRKG